MEVFGLSAAELQASKSSFGMIAFAATFTVYPLHEGFQRGH